jgi:hypothetical protein
LRLAADGDFRLAVQDIDHRVEGCRVLTQPLARVKCEERYFVDIFISVLLTTEPSA